jgi:hypothetical protein
MSYWILLLKRPLGRCQTVELEVEFWFGGELVYTIGSGPLSLATIVVLLYVNNMVLFNIDVRKLVEMLKVVDFWAI